MLTMEAYLDNSATTRCSEAAKNKMVEALTVDFGNPSSMHMKGVEAEKYVKEAATAIAKTLRCQEKEIVFTSGGTESNNLAIIIFIWLAIASCCPPLFAACGIRRMFRN